MIIKEREYQTCECCGTTKMVSDEEYGCDHCGKPIDMYGDEIVLRATLFFHGKDAHSLHFCSWRCALAKLSETSTDYFIDLPYLTFDFTRSERNAVAFWKAVREFGKVEQP
jgi:hypothetical protein